MKRVFTALIISVALNGAVHADGPREALVVGLSSYTVKDGLGMSGLPSPALDAERLGARLSALGWKVKVLVSRPEANASEATKERILSELKALGRNSDGMVLFAFSGHGYRTDNRDYLTAFDSHFVAGDGETQLAKSSLIDVEQDLGAIFRKMPARRRIMIVDACREEPPVAAKGLQVSSRTLSQKSAEVVGLSELGSVYSGVLFSCSPGEVSFDDPRLNGGKGASVFIEGILEAVKNPSGELLPEMIGKRAAAFVKQWKEKNADTATKGGRMLKDLTLRPQWRPSPDNDLDLAFSLSTVTEEVLTPEAARVRGVEALWAGNEADAVRLLTDAANRGNARAMAWLGYIAAAPRSGVPRLAEAVGWYRKAADRNDGLGHYWLGLAYQRGEGVTKDETQATALFKSSLDLLRKRADQGDAEAMTRVGSAYDNGRGVAKNSATALEWYKRAAALGDPVALNNIGTRYHNQTEGMSTDHAEARKYFELAAQMGLPVAMSNVGLMHDRGQGGLTKDPVEAAKWYRKAAEAGYSVAMGRLGKLLDASASTPDDAKAREALSWFRKGRAFNYSESLYGLGRFYELGRGGLVADRKQAIEWYKKAQAAGSTQADGRLRVLVDGLPERPPAPGGGGGR